MVDLNTNNIQVGENGQVRFTGSASGIDTQAIVESTIRARRVQAVQYERQIAENTREVSALNELKTIATDFRNVTDRLRGSTSFFAENTFDKKQGFLSSASAPSAPSDHTPTAAGQLMGAAISEDAEVNTHTITIENTAKAHQLRSDAFTSRTDA
jgi:Flagellar hook-associated protein 2 C-terminus.